MKHHDEMPDDVLASLGFVRTPSPVSETVTGWTHPRSGGQFYYHIMTPDAVASALIEIGHMEFRRAAIDSLNSLDMEN